MAQFKKKLFESLRVGETSRLRLSFGLKFPAKLVEKFFLASALVTVLTANSIIKK